MQWANENITTFNISAMLRQICVLLLELNGWEIT